MEISAVTDLVERVAYELVLPRFRDLSEDDVSAKGPGDLVTVVDTAAEDAITAGLTAIAPDVPVVGEEATAADPALLSALPELERAFLVDPIDGTRAFVEGAPDYAIMVALVEAGEPVAGWICLPSRGHTWVAERGSGAWRDGARLTPPARPERPRLRIAPSRGHDDVLAERSAAEGLEVGLGVPLWAGRSYTALADGEVDALGYWAGWPWDHAPGTALLRELGGVVAGVDASPYRATGLAGPMIAAGSADAFDRVRGLMLPDPRA
ncbi:inositol monophosphatase [Actinotalea sp. M2MS4P-6]|uniref:inositol monophosphatase family protein n=1 Tax=Actinotalea sp. M2MS4P-6 TaxID=2983762 RepID=UPI0021E36839|nr:inositol monophosphatase family protein [Actinotalea sp. M2MS4P-6]MCV2395504.1 inositol monophosphatase [Actinotalea sp. M2MS4P-6]